MPISESRIYARACLMIVTTVAVSVCAPCQAADTKAVAIANFAQVTPHIFRGAEPSRQDLHALKRLGVETILDLRMHYDAAEEAETKILGMRWIHMPLGYLRLSDKQVRALMAVLTAPANGKVFIHCAQGADRTGTVVAIYRILVQDWPLEMVFSEMHEHHFKPWWVFLRGRVETMRDCLDNVRVAQKPQPSKPELDIRRILLDNAANCSLDIATEGALGIDADTAIQPGNSSH